MDKNGSDNFHYDNHNNDEEIFREILEYYGEETVNSAALSAASPPKKRRKHRQLYAGLSIVCAVIFLTGTVILGGVLLNVKQPLPEESTDSSAVSSEIEKPDSSTASSDNGIYPPSALTSSASEAVSDSESDNIFIDSSNNDSYNNSVISENDRFPVDSVKSDSHDNSLISEIDSVPVDSVKGNSHDNSLIKSETPETPTSNVHEYSLPEIPDEGTVTSVHTDLDNNSITNPNDNVTTGDVVQAGIGIVLMILSLAVSLILNKLRAEDV